ncbi:DUF1801 domain-containing protein [Asticcacaulis benevestitus]|nr:DUF1801 domain-containing protein [Asticcacaulis benevestitus]
MAALDHPHKAAIETLRGIIMAVDPVIGEGIKWNAPSFSAPSVTGKDEWFATFHPRAKSGVQIILHRGAKVRGYTGTIDDPDQLLEWLATDRARLSFGDEADIAPKREPLTMILRQWIVQL